MAAKRIRIDTKRGFYPIVYVRGFAATAGEREETFYDTYYGYAATSVEKRDGVPPNYLSPIVFEGQLIRFLKEYGYVDAANGGLALAMSNPANIRLNPTRSVWISRFYDVDVMSEKVRPIESHAEDLRKLVCETIPSELKKIGGVDLGPGNRDYRVILIAHSMGGLVARCLIQNLLAGSQALDPPAGDGRHAARRHRAERGPGHPRGAGRRQGKRAGRRDLQGNAHARVP